MKTVLNSASTFAQRKLKINLALLAFILSTIFFLFQHYLDFSWDFVTYINNANFYFHNSSFFTLFLPPLAPILLGIFLFLGKLGEYLFIIFISALFFYSSTKLASSLNLDKTIFYIFSITPFALIYGIRNGTELLTLSFLELMLANLIAKKTSGHFLGLAFLTRYTSLIYLPLLFIGKSINSIVKNLVIFPLTILPWLLYNRIYFNNYFASFADSFAINIKFQQPSIPVLRESLPLIITIFILSPLLIYLIIKTIKNFNKNRIYLSKTLWIISLFFLLTIISFINTPIKDTRYLFNIVPILALLCTISIKKIKPEKKYILIFLAILSIILAVLISINSQKINQKDFKEVTSYIKNSNINNCQIYSNAWPYLNYFKINSKPHPRQELLNKTISNKGILIFLYKFKEPLYLSDTRVIESLPLITKQKDFIIIGTLPCKAKEQKIIRKYINEINALIEFKHGYDFGEDWCRILFSKNPEKDSTLSLLCKKIN